MCANFEIMHGLISTPNIVIPIGIAYCKKAKQNFSFNCFVKIKWSYKLNWINQCNSLILLFLTLKFYKVDTSNHIQQTG